MTGESFTEQAVRLIGFQKDPGTFLSILNGIFSSNIPMERTVLALKERFPLFLLSNTSELHLAYLVQHWKVLQHFQDGVYSFRAKVCKAVNPKDLRNRYQTIRFEAGERGLRR